MDIKDYVIASMLLGIGIDDEDAQENLKQVAVSIAGIIALGGVEKEETKKMLLASAESIYAQLPSLIEKLKDL